MLFKNVHVIPNYYCHNLSTVAQVTLCERSQSIKDPITILHLNNTI